MGRQLSNDKMQSEVRSSIARIVGSLVQLAIESGIGVKEIEEVVRKSAVGVAARRQTFRSMRVNASGIAAVTGLSRTEVDRLLKDKKSKPNNSERQTRSLDRILAAWHEDPEFLDTERHPLELKIFGDRRSFEALVKIHGRGIPLRAYLDELISLNVAEIVDARTVRVKARISMNRRLSSKSISSSAYIAANLLETLVENLEGAGRKKFVASIESKSSAIGSTSQIRDNIAKRGEDFLQSLSESVFEKSQIQSNPLPQALGDHIRFGVAVYYFENAQRSGIGMRDDKRRRNYRRKLTNRNE